MYGKSLYLLFMCALLLIYENIGTKRLIHDVGGLEKHIKN